LRARYSAGVDSLSILIDFRNEPDCISFYGDLEKQPTLIEALEYYVDRSDVKKAVEVYAELPPAARGNMTVEEFEKSQFLEKDLEDFLEKNLEHIEAGLELLGRQHPTTVGPIDLFARAKNGDLVVIELKKDRAADKVFGQLCRYTGCIKSEYAAGESVRGIIVAREMDVKLHYATRAIPDGLVTLSTFQFEKGDEGEHWIRLSSA
jgi:Endonuclease NucS